MKTAIGMNFKRKPLFSIIWTSNLYFNLKDQLMGQQLTTGEMESTILEAVLYGKTKKNADKTNTDPHCFEIIYR
jgi:hypothetical protein